MAYVQAVFFCFLVYRKPPTKGEDSRHFQNFRLYCARHSASLGSLGEIAQHRKQLGESRTTIKTLCCVVGKFTEKWTKSQIMLTWRGSLEKINHSGVFQKIQSSGLFRRTPWLWDPLSSRCYLSVRSAASVALQAQAAVAVASSDLLQGKSAFFSLSASNLPLASVISSAISPFPCIALLFLFLLLP